MAGCLFLLCACYQPNLSFKEAIEQGDRQAVEYYLKKGKSPNQRDAHAMPLPVLAAQNGPLAIMQDLLAAGADVNIVSKEGKTSLSVAKEGGFDKIVKLLQDALANK